MHEIKSQRHKWGLPAQRNAMLGLQCQTGLCGQDSLTVYFLRVHKSAPTHGGCTGTSAHESTAQPNANGKSGKGRGFPQQTRKQTQMRPQLSLAEVRRLVPLFRNPRGSAPTATIHELLCQILVALSFLYTDSRCSNKWVGVGWQRSCRHPSL